MSAQPQTVESVLAGIPSDRPHYLSFVADHERGRPWCRDCEAAEPILAKYIGTDPAENTVVWVGSRDAWNDPASPWRASPFNVERVPTVIKVPAGAEADIATRVAGAPKIVEAEILEGSVLKAFLKG